MKRERQMGQGLGSTIRTPYYLEKCSDCGHEIKELCHWGSVDSSGEIGQFCKTCMDDRYDDWCDRNPPKPIGYKLEKQVLRIEDLAKQIVDESKYRESITSIIPRLMLNMRVDSSSVDRLIEEEFGNFREKYKGEEMKFILDLVKKLYNH